MDFRLQLGYDGTFAGFLTAVTTGIKDKIPVTGFCRETGDQQRLFGQHRIIDTNVETARRLWERLGRKGPGLQRLIYYSFLSEIKEIELVAFEYLNLLFKNKGGSNEADSETRIGLRNRLVACAQKVEMEKSALEYGVAFSEYPEWGHIGNISPLYNVLPLLSRHFRHQFGKNPWILYDSKRHCGIRGVEGGFEFIHEAPWELRAAI